MRRVRAKSIGPHALMWARPLFPRYTFGRRPSKPVEAPPSLSTRPSTLVRTRLRYDIADFVPRPSPSTQAERGILWRSGLGRAQVSFCGTLHATYAAHTLRPRTSRKACHVFGEVAFFVDDGLIVNPTSILEWLRAVVARKRRLPVAVIRLTETVQLGRNSLFGVRDAIRLRGTSHGPRSRTTTSSSGCAFSRRQCRNRRSRHKRTPE